MTVNTGVNLSPPYDADRDAARVKPQFHRPNLIFQPLAFIVTLNKASQVDGVDFTALLFSTYLTAAASVDDTTITVNSVWGLANAQTITINDGNNTETKVIRSIDPSTKVVTLTVGLTNSYASGVGSAVTQPRVKVSYDENTKKTTIDYIVAGQNTDSALAGMDVQRAISTLEKDKEFANFDMVEAQIIVPYWIGTWIEIVGAILTRAIYKVSGETKLDLDAQEAASAIGPNYILRMIFTSGEETPTVKKIKIKLGEWRG